MNNQRFCVILFLLGGLLLGFHSSLKAQDKERWQVFLDEDLNFTTAKKKAYTAFATKEATQWILEVQYPDSSLLLKASYTGKSLNTKEGPLILYHPTHQPAMEGSYKENLQEGHWNYWHPNGKLKDSGEIVHNYLTGTWCSYDDQGLRLICATYLSAAEARMQPIPPFPNYKKSGIFQKDTLVHLLNGPWTTYYGTGNIKEKGNFDYNKRNGLWETYYPSGKKESSGNFVLQKQAGDWTYYHASGQPSTKEHYDDQGKITELACFDSTGQYTGISCSILKPPVPIAEGFTDMRNYILDHVFWPKDLENSEFSGLVKANCTISIGGKLTAIEFLESPHPLMTLEVERFLKSIPEWSPAISHNRPIPYTFRIEIPFIDQVP